MSDSEKKWLMDFCIGDDTGDNISSLNRKYCELSAHYWAWKNYEQLGDPDYIGFMHYCRLFILSRKDQGEKRIFLPMLTKKMIENYLCSFDYSIEDYDMIIPHWLESYKFSVKRTAYQWERNPPAQCRVIDRNPGNIGLEEALHCIKIHHPKYLQTAQEYLSGKMCFQWSMFICRKDIFFDYASFIFDVLQKVEQVIDDQHFCVADSRYLGYLGEHLTGIYILKKIQEDARVLHLPIWQVIYNTLPEILRPAFIENPVAITCSIEDNSFMHGCVLIQSVIQHATPGRKYDIVILEKSLSSKNKEKIKMLGQNSENISIRFYNINRPLFENFPSQYKSGDYCALTRLLLTGIFANYVRVVYIDNRSLVLRDIAFLSDIDIEEELIGACRDLTASTLLNKDKSRLNTYKRDLGIQNPYNEYFSDAVLIFNMKSISESGLGKNIQESVTNARTAEDVCNFLNRTFYGHVKWIDQRWNVCPQWSNMEFMSHGDCSEFDVAMSQPFIICFRGTDSKPWNNPGLDHGFYWWSVAYNSPFFAEILFSGLRMRAQQDMRGMETKLTKRIEESVSPNKIESILKLLPRNNQDTSEEINVFLHDLSSALRTRITAEEMQQTLQMMRNVALLEDYRRKLKRVRWRVHLSWGKRKQRYLAQKKQLKDKIYLIEKFIRAK